MPSNHLVLCRSLLLLPSIFPSIRVFSKKSVFPISQSIGASPSVFSESIQDWFPLGLTGLFSLQSKGLFKSLLQHHNSKASILQHSDFFMVQLSHPYMTTEKTITLTIWTFVGKAMSLLFNMPSKLVIVFLSKEQASFNFMAAVTICSDFGAQENSLSLCALFPYLFAMKWWDQMP